MKCKCCNQELPEYHANNVSIHGMFDMHLFCPFKGSTVEEILEMWREQNSKPYPAIVGDMELDDLGFAYLCPVIVLHDKQELRRVGEMVFPEKPGSREPNEKQLIAWINAVKSDPDITRILAERIV